MDKLFWIFLLSFVSNYIWENLHSYLYENYRGNKITQKALIRASLLDSLFITTMAVFFIEVPYFRLRIWYAFIFGLIAATILEIWALKINRWKYNKFMPIIPIIKTGFTPTIQLGVLSYLIYSIILN